MKQKLLDESTAAGMLAALGSPARLRVYRALIRAGDAGINLTDLQAAVGIPASTLAHHLGMLVDAGLVARERRGRELICSARYDQVRRVSEFLIAECCARSRPAGKRPA
jgi:ArsR family transcriptional regulator